MKYIICTAATVLGLFLRTIICALHGWQYSINGADIVVAAAMFCLAYSLCDLIAGYGRHRHKKDRKERR